MHPLGLPAVVLEDTYRGGGVEQLRGQRVRVEIYLGPTTGRRSRCGRQLGVIIALLLVLLLLFLETRGEIEVELVVGRG